MDVTDRLNVTRPSVFEFHGPTVSRPAIHRLRSSPDAYLTVFTGCIRSARKLRGIEDCLSADNDSDWCTMTEAAKELGVTNHVIRRLIKDGELPAEQLVPRAPYQIKVVDLHSGKVADALARQKGPCRAACRNQMSMFSDT